MPWSTEQPQQPVVRLRGAARELRGLETLAGFQSVMPDLHDEPNPDGLRRSTRERKHVQPVNIESFNIFSEYQYILYEQVLLSDRKDAAVKALDKELDAAELMKIWNPILDESLTPEQRKYIIDAVTNFVEKWLASGGFDKFKVRVIARGDQQQEHGETSSPVYRIESVFMIAMIAAYLGLDVFKFNVMPEEVLQKWLLLNKHVSARLVERDTARYGKFKRRDGKSLVQMNKLTYGYKEAALGWYRTFMELLGNYKYERMPKHSCFLFKTGKREGDILLVAICVDDGFGAATPGSGLKEEYLDAIRTKFTITVKEKDEIDFLGVSFKFDHENSAVSLSQRNFVSQLVKAYSVDKTAKTPSLADLFEEDPVSLLLKDQLAFLSLNSSCNFAATRTFPEILPCSSTLASRYYKATEQDLREPYVWWSQQNKNKKDH